MKALERRVTRMDHRVPAHILDLSRLTDDQLEDLIVRRLTKADPALAARYEAAGYDERGEILKNLTADAR